MCAPSAVPANVDTLLAVCVCAATIAFALPPVVPWANAVPAPSTNLSLRSNVPLVPSANCQPSGIVLVAPDQIAIVPIGIPMLSVFSVLLTGTLVSPVTRPFASTVICGIVTAPPYVPAATPVAAKFNPGVPDTVFAVISVVFEINVCAGKVIATLATAVTSPLEFTVI